MPVNLRALLADLSAGDDSTSSSSGDESLIDSDTAGPLDAGTARAATAASSGAAVSAHRRQTAALRPANCSDSDSSSSTSSDEALDFDPAGPSSRQAAPTPPHRLVRLRTVLYLVLRLILSITSDTDDNARAVSSRADGSERVGGRSGDLVTGSGGAGRVDKAVMKKTCASPSYPDAQEPWSRLAGALGDLQKAWMAVRGGSSAGGGVSGQPSGTANAYLAVHLLRMRLIPLIANRSYTKNLSKGEARASTVVGRLISALPEPPSPSTLDRLVDCDSHVFDRPSRLEATVLLRFAACALHIPQHPGGNAREVVSGDAIDYAGQRRPARLTSGPHWGGVLDLSHLNYGRHGPWRKTARSDEDEEEEQRPRTQSFAPKARFARHALFQLDWEGTAAAVGLNMEDVRILSLRGNGLYGNDLERIDPPTRTFPNLQSIDISHQAITAVPLRWLVVTTPGGAGAKSVRAIRLRPRKTDCAGESGSEVSSAIPGISMAPRRAGNGPVDDTRPAACKADGEILFLGRQTYRNLAQALHSAGLASTRTSSTSGSNSITVSRRQGPTVSDDSGRGTGVQSLLDTCISIAARQYLLLINSTTDGPTCPAGPGRCGDTAVVDSADDTPAFSGDEQTGVATAASDPYRALPAHLYDRIASADECDLCSHLSFPSADTAPARAPSGWKGCISFAYPADTLPRQSSHLASSALVREPYQPGSSGQGHPRYSPPRTAPSTHMGEPYAYRAGGGGHVNFSRTGRCYDLRSATTTRHLANDDRSDDAAVSAGQGYVRVRGRVCRVCLKWL